MLVRIAKDEAGKAAQIDKLEGAYFFYEVMVNGKSARRFIAIEKEAIARKGKIAGARAKFDEPNGAPDLVLIEQRWLQENTKQRDASACVKVHPRLAEFLLSE